MDPSPFTLRELVVMAEARGRADWARTSAIMALAVNLVRDPRKGKPAKPSDFDPYADHVRPRKLRGRELEILKEVFCRPENGT